MVQQVEDAQGAGDRCSTGAAAAAAAAPSWGARTGAVGLCSGKSFDIVSLRWANALVVAGAHLRSQAGNRSYTRL